jgi:hypothetical protein
MVRNRPFRFPEDHGGLVEVDVVGLLWCGTAK